MTPELKNMDEHITRAELDRDTDVVIIVGPNGQRAVSDARALGCKRIVVIDPAGTRKYMPGEFPPDVQITHSVSDLNRAFVNFGKEIPKRCMQMTSSGSTPEVMERLGAAVTAIITTLATSVLMEPKWKAYGAENLKKDVKNAVQEGRRHEGRPVIIVGAGPSLSLNMSQLKDAKVPIIALCHVAKLLHANGIKPDYIISVDPVDDVTGHFNGVPLEDVTLILTMTSPPSLWDLPAKDKWGFVANAYWDDWILEALGDQSYRVDSAGSAATAAIALVAKWGAKTTILVGQDYARVGNMYADGISHLPINEEHQTTTLAVGNDWTRHSPLILPTTRELEQFRRWIENAGYPVVQASEQGAHIRGMQHMKLKDALARYA